MAIAISSATTYTPPTFLPANFATLFTNNALADTATTNSEATLLQAELATYTQQLAAVETGDTTAPGALSAAQIQQQIASIQQQLDALNSTSTYTDTAQTTSALTGANIIDTFV
ncbi:MAG: hypothetical protein JWM78_1355 [Verrucomicrobiaceae bacterium]|nr:hypothetical protein [Verrucomicrobiaceae bacterium]